MPDPTPANEAASASRTADEADLAIFWAPSVASANPFLDFSPVDPGRPWTPLDENGRGVQAVADENATNDGENASNIKIVPPPPCEREQKVDPDGAVGPSKRKKRKGIQPGQVAQNCSSKDLHQSLGRICQKVLTDLQVEYPTLIWQKGLTGKEISELTKIEIDEETRTTGCQPDGGIFLWVDPRGGRIPLVGFEAKNQADRGNAIERWFKNWAVLKSFGPRFCYITFCTGLGAAPEGIIVRILNNALLSYGQESLSRRIRKWNRFYTSGPSLYRSVRGFSEARMETIVRKALLAALIYVKRR